MMNNTLGNITLHFLIGLPDSGQTQYSLKMLDSTIINLDHYANLEDDPSNYHKYQMNLLSRAIVDIVKPIEGKCNKSFVINGTFTTNEHVFDAIKYIAESINANDAYDIDVILHVWSEDRKACLINNKFNGEENCFQAICELPYEVVDDTHISSMIFENDLKNVYVDKIINHTTKAFIYDCGRYYNLTNDFELISDSWKSGGTERDYYGDLYYDGPESPQADFKELDAFIRLFYPNISYRDYKTAYDASVHIDSTYVEDGKRTYENFFWTCDIIKFCEALDELGYPNLFNFDRVINLMENL